MEANLQSLWSHGELHFDSPPSLELLNQSLIKLFHKWFEQYQLALAGPPLTLNAEVALAAANYVQQAAWLLVNREEQTDHFIQRLISIPEAKSAHDLVSADLLLRYLPQLYQRAVAISPDDVLSQHLKQTLLQWPLSGVLANLANPPPGTLHFFGHRGIQFRYAERLAQRPRGGWGPIDSASLEAVTLVFELKQISLEQLKVISIPTQEEATENE